jgi:excisionase family DNA binding protein
LYLRRDEAARAIGVSRRTLSAWQSARLIGFRRVGRTVLFSVADIQAAIDRYRIAPVGEPQNRKHRMERICPIPQSENIAVGNTPIQAEVDCAARSAAE